MRCGLPGLCSQIGNRLESSYRYRRAEFRIGPWVISSFGSPLRVLFVVKSSLTDRGISEEWNTSGDGVEFSSLHRKDKWRSVFTITNGFHSRLSGLWLLPKRQPPTSLLTRRALSGSHVDGRIIAQSPSEYDVSLSRHNWALRACVHCQLSNSAYCNVFRLLSTSFALWS